MLPALASSALVLAGVVLRAGWLAPHEGAQLERAAKLSAETPTSSSTPKPAQSGPADVTIKGKRVPLAPGMTYEEVNAVADGVLETGTAPAPTPQHTSLWKISYDSDPSKEGFSWVYYTDYQFISKLILPEDQEEFQPILEALLGYVTIKGRDVLLAPGMVYWGGSTSICEEPPCPTAGFTHVEYDSDPSEAGQSSLVFDEKYSVRESQILPEDEQEFQPLLDALASP